MGSTNATRTPESLLRGVSDTETPFREIDVKVHCFCKKLMSFGMRTLTIEYTVKLKSGFYDRSRSERGLKLGVLLRINFSLFPTHVGVNLLGPLE